MISDRIKQLREKGHMSQKELAERLNVSPSTVGMYEQGRRTPDSNVLIKLANILDCSTDYILGRVDDPEVKIVKKEDLPEELAKYVDYIEVLKDANMANISPDELREVIEFAKKIKENN